MEPVKNPLLQWVGEYPQTTRDEMDIIMMNPGKWRPMVEHLIGLVQDAGFPRMPYCPDCSKCSKDVAKQIPTCIAKELVSYSLLNDEIIQEMVRFSNNHIYEIGGGSGYNAWMLDQAGCHIASCDLHPPIFPFFGIEEYKSDIMEDVAKNNGALLYIWPSYTEDTWDDPSYPRLTKWEQMGGKYVITIGDHNPKKPPKCPLFPPSRSKNKWRLVKEMTPPRYIFDTYDMVQFWIRGSP